MPNIKVTQQQGHSTSRSLLHQMSRNPPMHVEQNLVCEFPKSLAVIPIDQIHEVLWR